MFILDKYQVSRICKVLRQVVQTHLSLGGGQGPRLRGPMGLMWGAWVISEAAGWTRQGCGGCSGAGAVLRQPFTVFTSSSVLKNTRFVAILNHTNELTVRFREPDILGIILGKLLLPWKLCLSLVGGEIITLIIFGSWVQFLIGYQLKVLKTFSTIKL